MPVDYTFPAGHRLGIVLIANLNALQRNGTTGTTVTLNTKLSKIDLPIVGGYAGRGHSGRARARHGHGHRSAAAVPGHARPHASAARRSRPFTPGVTQEYTASTTAQRHQHRRRRDALACSDPGHLTNGAFIPGGAAAGRACQVAAGPRRPATSR